MYKRREKFMTYNEKIFYYKLLDLKKKYNYIIQPQINLATIIKKKNHKYANDLYRNIDFGIFTDKYDKLLLLIELNDKSHYRKDRKERDKKVKKITEEAGIKLITFHTKDPNRKEYVINRILKEIETEKEK